MSTTAEAIRTSLEKVDRGREILRTLLTSWAGEQRVTNREPGYLQVGEVGLEFLDQAVAELDSFADRMEAFDARREAVSGAGKNQDAAVASESEGSAVETPDAVQTEATTGRDRDAQLQMQGFRQSSSRSSSLPERGFIQAQLDALLEITEEAEKVRQLLRCMYAAAGNESDTAGPFPNYRVIAEVGIDILNKVIHGLSELAMGRLPLASGEVSARSSDQDTNELPRATE